MQDNPGSYELIQERVARWAGSRPDIAGILVAGSRARQDRPADDHSDLDLIIIAEDPRTVLGDASWLDEIGQVLFTFTQRTPIGGFTERRVLFHPALDVDLAVVPATLLQPGVAAASGDAILRRGFRILYERDEALHILRDLTFPGGGYVPPDAATFAALVNDFWYHAQSVAKKLFRGELLFARRLIDCGLSRQLGQLVEWHVRAAEPDRDTWHAGRFFEEWADEDLREAVHGTFGPASQQGVATSLGQVMHAFDELAVPLAGRFGYPYPASNVRHLRDWIEARLVTG